MIAKKTMKLSNELRFTVSDRIRDVAVTPAHIPLALLGEFQKDVSEFLRGSVRDVDLMQVQISIEEGSFAFVATGLATAMSLWSDLGRIQSSDALSQVDFKRAAVVERWQSAAKKNPNRRYVVQEANKEPLFAVDKSTDFRLTDEVWVNVEKYLHGKIVDWGGKTKANVHLDLGNGKTMSIETSQNLISQEEHNLVYRMALLHVTAEENLISGDLRNLRLLAFEHHQPAYDDIEFKRMVERGTQAWAGIEDSSAWLESLRGS
ncbi:hypothetical protein [Ferrovum sp.]|uniref:hypothetical protein n=1 Tax=Ferrovum sp. TaxID=2609467 RepID=UPI00261641C5|nr:hypothetical protein [Ferrovum sp.]